MAEQNWVEIPVSRVLKIDRNVDIRHAETADACRLIRQGLLMAMQPEIDDVADAQCVDISQLRFGRLTGCGYPVIEPTPIVDGFRVDHHSRFWLSGGARRGTRLIGADSFPRISKPCFPSTSRVSTWPCRIGARAFPALSFPCPISYRKLDRGSYPIQSNEQLSRLQRRQHVGGVNATVPGVWTGSGEE